MIICLSSRSLMIIYTLTLSCSLLWEHLLTHFTTLFFFYECSLFSAVPPKLMGQWMPRNEKFGSNKFYCFLCLRAFLCRSICYWGWDITCCQSQTCSILAGWWRHGCRERTGCLLHLFTNVNTDVPVVTVLQSFTVGCMVHHCVASGGFPQTFFKETTTVYYHCNMILYDLNFYIYY